jgi:hypothetical protein
MSRYPSDDVERIDQQWAETEDERNERLRQKRLKKHDPVMQSVASDALLSAAATIDQQKEFYAKLVEQMINEKPWCEKVWARASLATAARAIRRGRHLSGSEKLANLKAALIEEAEPPYGPMCRDPDLCAGKGYCPRDPTCGD